MAKNNQELPEKRKHPRVKFHEKIKVHRVVESKSGNVFEVQGNPIITKAEDVSEGGIRLTLKSPPSGNPILKLNFKVKKDNSN